MNFINEIVQSEWAHLKELQDKLALYQTDPAAIDNKAVEILRNLIDDYYICLGQLEALPTEQVKADLDQPKKEIETALEIKANQIMAVPISAVAKKPTVTPELAGHQVEIPLNTINTDYDLVTSAPTTVDYDLASGKVDTKSGVSEDDM